MTRVSRNPLNKKEKFMMIEEFWHALGQLNKGEVAHFFNEFFSPTEILMFAKRLDILKGLRKNISYENLRMGLKVTEPTIAKMSTILQRGDENFLHILDQLMKGEDHRWQDYLESRKPHVHGKMIFHVHR